MQIGSQINVVLIFVTLLTSNYGFAQKTPAKIDSTKVYGSIESFSLKSKFTRFAYQLVFKPLAVSSTEKSAKRKAYAKLKQKPYSAFEGKIIRYIHIETLDPFGYSIADTVVRSPNFITKNGNRLHIKSHRLTIRNLLLIRQNQVFDSLLVKESERLVRSRGYVTDVSFYVSATAPRSDSVDIFIRELDKWSLIPKGAVSTTGFTINLNDNNFLGLGHESKNEYTWNHAAGKYSYSADYYIPNFRNTYINSRAHLGTGENGGFSRVIAMDRPFFSPFAKWAAGVYFSQQQNFNFIHTADSVLELQQFRYNTQDYWVGSAIQLFKGNTENDRTTNFITAFRFLKIRYLDKPAEEDDPGHYFANENLYLVSAGISTRKYVQDRYIFRFGVTEDVPVGKVFNLTAGYQVKNKTHRPYLGGRVSSGTYFSWGYLSYNCEYGVFIHSSQPAQGVLSVGVNYYTTLFELGKWKFRHFIKPQLTLGMNRNTYDSITINDGYGLDGFNSLALSGTSRCMVKLQTQAYSPWNFIGFRFGPFVALSLGMLGHAGTGFKNSSIYSLIGVGVLIKNEHLVINTFQISFAFYPVIPGKGENIFRLNSFRTTDFGFRDFETGKPSVVTFQ